MPPTKAKTDGRKGEDIYKNENLGSIRECFITLMTLASREGTSGNNPGISGISLIVGFKIQVWRVVVVIFEIYAFLFCAGCTGQIIFWTYMDLFHDVF